jgi:two-component system response regulator VicR
MRAQTGSSRGPANAKGTHVIKNASRTRRILVIDDEQPVADLIRDVLRRHGYMVDVHSGGEAALEVASGGDYGLVISDFAIPGLNGLEFARQFGALRPEVAVLIVSAFLDPETARELETQQNVRGLIRKPFDIFELVDRVDACLGIEQIPGSRAEMDA